MIGPMARIIVLVGDVPALARWYHEALGLPLLPSHDPAGWQELDAGGCRLALHQAHGPDGPITHATGSPMNPHKIVFCVDDVPAACAALKEKGVDMDEPQDHGVVVLCDGRDPEGHVFQLSNR